MKYDKQQKKARKVECPHCQSTAAHQRRIYATGGVRFVGSGFYENDYKVKK